MDVLADGSSGLIGEVSALAVSDSGLLFVTDRLGGSVHVFDSLGNHVRTIGRKGQGPGELSGPRTVATMDSAILVIDEGNARLQTLSLSGESLDSRPLLPAPAGGHWSLRSDGVLARPTLGFDSALVKLSDGNDRELARLGTPIGVPSSVIQPRATKQDLIEGRIPAIFLNTARPVLGNDTTVWLISPSRSVVEAYTFAGARIDSLFVAEPEFALVREENMAINAALPGFRMRPPEFLLDGQVEDGALWVLAATGEQGTAKLLQIEPGHGVIGALSFPGVRGAQRFAFDFARGWVYFTTEEGTTLVRVRRSEGS